MQIELILRGLVLAILKHTRLSASVSTVSMPTGLLLCVCVCVVMLMPHLIKKTHKKQNLYQLKKLYHLIDNIKYLTPTKPFNIDINTDLQYIKLQQNLRSSFH